MTRYGDGIDRLVPEVGEVPSPPRRSVSYDDLRQEARIGTGGTANVYRVTVADAELDGPLALKEPRADDTVTVDDRLVEAFVGEADLWSRLDGYDGVVGVVDYGRRPLPWILTEYMDGGNLRAHAGADAAGTGTGTDTATGTDLPRALWFARSVADAVWSAHGDGVAHLDIKPENVLLRATPGEAWPYPKICDFGISRILLEGAPDRRAYTLRYAAPEQLDPGEFGDPDNATDVYQVGVLLYELVTGRVPFPGGGPGARRAILSEDPTPPSELVPAAPAGLDAVVLTALRKRPGDRFEAMLDLRRAVDDLLRSVDPAADRGGSGADGGTGAGGVGARGSGASARTPPPDERDRGTDGRDRDPGTDGRDRDPGTEGSDRPTDERDGATALDRDPDRTVERVGGTRLSIARTPSDEPLDPLPSAWSTARGDPRRTASVPGTSLRQVRRDWSVGLVDATVAGPLVTATRPGSPPERSVLVPRSDGLSVLDLAAGTQRWRYADRSPVRDAAAVDGRVYLDAGGDLVALGVDGDPCWTVAGTPTERSHRGRSLAVGHGRVYWVDDDRIRAFDAGTGREVWASPPDAPDPAGPLALADGAVVYTGAGFGTDDAVLVALRSADGALLWRVHAGENRRFAGYPLVHDGLVHAVELDVPGDSKVEFGEPDGDPPAVVAVDRSGESVAFECSVGEEGSVRPPPAVVLDGQVSLVGDRLHAVADPAVPSADLADASVTDAAATGGGLLVVGTTDGLFVSDPTDRERLFEFLDGEWIREVAVAGATPGVHARPPVVVAATEDEVYAFSGIATTT